MRSPSRSVKDKMPLFPKPRSSAIPFVPNPFSQRPPQQQQHVLEANPPVGSNYRPIYIAHPGTVQDPYAHWREISQAQSESLYTWKIPRLSLRIEDLANPATDVFLRNVKPQEVMRNAVISVLECLYTVQSQPRNVKSVTLILRDFDGVAHTTGSARDNDDKEIHFSTRHIKGCEANAREEITGVIVHEVVHCFQYDARGTCPSGLTEGIADFVRLRSSLAPPHWKRNIPNNNDKWDAGYEKTAYFLDWIEKVIGPGTIQAINEGMRNSRYDNGRVWRDVTGQSVQDLWVAYRASF